MTQELGTNYTICRNKGNRAAPSWAPLSIFEDVSVTLQPAASFDSSDRTSSNDSVIPTRYKVEISANTKWDGGTALTAIRNAFVAGSPIELAALDKAPGSGGWGVRADWAVTAFPLDHPLKDGQKLQLKFQPHGQYFQGASSASTTLAGDIDNSVTSLTVASSSSFPPTPFVIVIGTEDLLVTNVSGTTWTVTRGYNSTTPASHTSGASLGLGSSDDYSPQFYTDNTGSAGSDSPGTKKLGTAASLNTSAGLPIPQIMNLKFGIQPGTLFDSSNRASLFDTVIPTRFKYNCEGDFLWDSSNALLTAFRTAFVSNAPIELYALDGPYATTGSWGIHADWALTDFSFAAPLKDGQKVSFKLEPHGNGSVPTALVTIS